MVKVFSLSHFELYIISVQIYGDSRIQYTVTVFSDEMEKTGISLFSKFNRFYVSGTCGLFRLFLSRS